MDLWQRIFIIAGSLWVVGIVLGAVFYKNTLKVWRHSNLGGTSSGDAAIALLFLIIIAIYFFPALWAAMIRRSIVRRKAKKRIKE